jgi:hypothetical protein
MAPVVGGIAHGSVKKVPSSRTGTDGPQAEERAIAADAHHLARVQCDEFFRVVYHLYTPPWPVSVNYQHWPVGISGWYFCTVSFGGNTF